VFPKALFLLSNSIANLYQFDKSGEISGK